MNNVVMISKNSDSLKYQEQNVIFNKNAAANSSPQVVLRDKALNTVQKPTSSTENLLSSDDNENTAMDLPDMGDEQDEALLTHKHLPDDSSKRESLSELERQRSTVDIERLKQGSSEINISFPKEQV